MSQILLTLQPLQFLYQSVPSIDPRDIFHHIAHHMTINIIYWPHLSSLSGSQHILQQARARCISWRHTTLASRYFRSIQPPRCTCIVAFPAHPRQYSQSGMSIESDFSDSSPLNMAKNTGLQIDNTILCAGIAILLFLKSLSSLDDRTTRLISLSKSLLNMKIPLSVIFALGSFHVSWKTAMI